MTAKRFLRSSEGFTSIQAAATFGVLGLLASVTVAPYLQDPEVSTETLYQFSLENDVFDPGIDQTVTGSVDAPAASVATRRYILTQSVLQKDPKAVCITFEDGHQEGSC